MNNEIDNLVPSDNPRDIRAAEYVLGLLGEPEHAQFKKDLEQDERLRERVAFWETRFFALSNAVEEVAPSPGLFSNIEAAIDGKPQPGSINVRGDEGEWLQLFDGVHKKVLLQNTDEGAESFLLRIDAGASCPAHSHSMTEECLVLEGEMIIGRARFKAGDFHAAPPNIPHLPITSEIGVLLYVRAEMHV